ncbi:MAG: hypothetical protein SAL07_00165 [Oscillatoria sp. PMC 1051.18]|nr:hypothetical protein [Oscillatoria sp. PMC 1050.18]MEC5028300.1 hypothetical protein [Oscillatoria sp. PMC 1051.18]
MLEKALQLKEDLVNFVLDAEGDLAVALESYAAANAAKTSANPLAQRQMTIDAFVCEGEVGEKTPIDLFISESKLSPDEQNLVNSWQRGFAGLFEILKSLSDGFELMNWLTAKKYIVKQPDKQKLTEMERFKPGEILLTRIAPLNEKEWFFFSPYVAMGKLGKPKLAVAIGNFKENYKSNLYGDAPELLEEAWESVARYHQEFLNFFGAEKVTISGYELSKKLAEIQDKMVKDRLKAAGIDESKSLGELAAEAGVSEAEITAAAAESGADTKEVAKMFKSGSKMVLPKVELPEEIKRANEVTAFSHPRWGQMFVPTYTEFTQILTNSDWENNPQAASLVRQYLQNPKINYFVWQQLAEEYPTQLEQLLQTILERPNLNLKQDLPGLLKEYDKPLEPELPESASVPVHLHNLFQEAVAQLNKSKSKSKGKKKKSKGFQ